MKMKMFTIALVLAGSVFVAACDEVGYTCDGAGTCDAPRYCINENTLDYYWIVNGHNFYDAYEVAEYCVGDPDVITEGNVDVNVNDDYSCGGAGTCDEPLVCCNPNNCYYEVEGSTFYCDAFDCEAAASEMVAFCM
ncbi:MAG TPA: hypothetical protein PLY68_05685 [Myxococcota bacterium]|nr:hypothetical protein [Myxococcota bacterium]HQP95672.1 hypothetical protein [Myxococcota bacterium]